MKYAQFFCSVNDLVADKQSPGVDESRMFQAIKEASEWVQKKIGWFIPVTMTRRFCGNDADTLLIPASLLAIDTISNDGIALSTADYVLKPDHGFWTNGPYGQLDVDEESGSLLGWSSVPNSIVINGRWGLYELVSELDATVQDDPKQTDAQKTLTVDHGGQLSPGMVLKIGDEQQAVIGWESPTESVTAINMAGTLLAADEVMVVDDASKVQVGEIIRLQFEQCKVKDRRISTNELSLIRGWNGTGRVTHANDTAVDVFRTVTVERGVNGTTAAEHTKSTQISCYSVPDDILLLVKEIAMLSVNKAQSGYQGRTGNQDTGVVFYNDIFPKYDIEQIKQNYRIRVAR